MKSSKNSNGNPFLSSIIVIIFLFPSGHQRVSVSSYEVQPIQMPPGHKTVVECSLLTSIPTSAFQTFRPNNEFKSFGSVPPTPSSIQKPKDDLHENHTPCVFTRQYTHSFPVCAGSNFIRLHFNPTSVSGLNISNAVFSVDANRYTLLTTTESSYPIDALNNDNYYFIKEFYVNVEEQILDVTFTPSSDSSEFFAFVNMIEVVSIPPDLYIRENSSLLLMGHPNSEICLDNSTAFETMYRLNVGGDTISAEEDTGMYRVWSEDSDYLTTDTDITDVVQSQVKIMGWLKAPSEVYSTARSLSLGDHYLTWSFQVDSGFNYLIRLHFCEISKHVIRDERVFHVYIDRHTAEQHADVLRWSNQSGVPVCKDYVVNLTKNSHGLIQEVRLTLQRNAESFKRRYPILNGLEIFKLSNANNSLAGPNPFRPTKPLPPITHYRIKTIITMILLISILALPFVYAFLLHFPKICHKFGMILWSCYNNRIKKHYMKWELSEQCRYFSFTEIKSATNNFSDIYLIGSGGFGKVYKGYINGQNKIDVAIKRGSPTSRQGSIEFQTEIATLSRLRHCHLVSLIGYCMDHEEMILVYDLMARGNLRDHLYNTINPPLPWEKRLKICIGAARGLHYLHTGMDDTIIHRDVKTTNILLNEEWVAKVSDFGLSKLGPNLLHQSETHVSTLVKGSFGYLDPEYYRRQTLTEKSDVYSFGVVLFEVLCARPALIPTVEEEEVENYVQVNLAEWVLHCDQIGTLDQIIDPHLEGKIDPKCFKTFTDIAKKCLANRRNERPTMGDVLCNLELAWHQQIGVLPSEGDRNFDGNNNSNICCEFSVFVMNNDGQKELGICHSDSSTPETEFFEIVSPIGP